MPNCFTLTPKIEGAKPKKFAIIDDEMRVHFGAEPDPKAWYCQWYDIVGQWLAVGKDFDWMRERFAGLEAEYADGYYQKLIDIVDYLDERYESSAWYQAW